MASTANGKVASCFLSQGCDSEGDLLRSGGLDDAPGLEPRRHREVRLNTGLILVITGLQNFQPSSTQGDTLYTPKASAALHSQSTYSPLQQGGLIPFLA